MARKLNIFKHLDTLSDLGLKHNVPLSKDHLFDLRKVCCILSTEASLVDFKTWFNFQDGLLLSLECLWQLQSHNLLQFTTYIHNNAHLIDALSDKFGDQIWCEDESVRGECAQTVAGLLSVLVHLGIHSPLEVYRPAHHLLTLVTDKFVNRLLQEDGGCEEPVEFLPQLLGSPSCVQSRLTPFCLSLLRAVVQSTPESVTLEDALRDQAALYTTSKTSPVIIQVLQQILSRLAIKEVIDEMKRVITSEEKFNWRWLLTTISVLTASSLEAAQSIKGMISSLMLQACTNKSERLLAPALLCARQCCAEDSHKFGSYSSWFSSLQLRPASSFTFFFDFLSQLVPDEPVLYLKIHINKVPSAPPNCHGVIADYASLAKTRLADLNQTTDYVGLFGEYTTTEQEGREADVGRVVAHFTQTREVMKVVLEASVFRRQFYEKVFLAELLKNSNIEHREFIEKLYSLGKIPHGLYNRWRLSYPQGN